MKANNTPTITSLITNGRRRLVYVYDDGRQMIQEYDMKTHQILMRKIKKPSTFKQAKWEFQIGDAFQKNTQGEPLLMKANNNPIFVRKDTLESFQWRVRNLAYPAETYIIETDPNKQEIVIKTTNKKYYKRFDIPDLKRMNIKIEKQNISHDHKNQTLIVSYKKPDEYMEKQIKMRKQFDKMNNKKPKQGDVQCTTQ